LHRVVENFLRRSAIIAVAGTLAVFGGSPAPAQAASTGSTLQTLINQDRAAAALAPLAWSDCLAAVALENAQRIANQGYLSHTDGPTKDMACGVGSTGGGENVAYISSGIDDTAVNTMYMNSPGHKANILGAYSYVATAWVVAPNGYAYNAEEFLNASSVIPGPTVVPTTAWEPLGGVLQSGAGASTSGTTRVDVFIRGQDAQLWHRRFDGAAWSGWEPLGGTLTSDPSAVASGARIDVFGRGQDNQLWHKSFNGTSWSGWEPLGGILGSGPASASLGSGRLDVFARGQDGQLWQKTFNGTAWAGWQPLGGIITADPSAVSWGANRIDVMARGQDNRLWHRWFDGASWSGWELLGGILASRPVVTSWGSGRLDVFIQGQDNALWHKSFGSAGWSGWGPMGGILNAGPGAAAPAVGVIHVFMRGQDRQLWHAVVSG
jgi:cysteine-rich secretory family protein